MRKHKQKLVFICKLALNTKGLYHKPNAKINTQVASPQLSESCPGSSIYNRHPVRIHTNATKSRLSRQPEHRLNLYTSLHSITNSEKVGYKSRYLLGEHMADQLGTNENPTCNIYRPQ